MKTSKWIFLILATLFISTSFALGQNGCFSNSTANSVPTKCTCSNKTVPAGQCQGADTSTVCVFMSYYTCGISGSQTCQVAFAEDMAVCPPSSQVKPKNTEMAYQLYSAQNDSIQQWLKFNQSHLDTSNDKHCMNAVARFQAWLISELASKHIRLSGGSQ